MRTGLSLAIVMTLWVILLGHTALAFESKPELRAPPETVQLLSIFNPTVVDHVYTTNASEIELFQKFYGFTIDEETNTGSIFSSEQPGTIPFFRLYSLGAEDHFYTTSIQERDHAVKRLGYIVEGTLGYIYSSDGPGRVAFFQLRNPTRNDHYYTTSAYERDEAARNGWDNQGIVGYIIP